MASELDGALIVCIPSTGDPTVTLTMSHASWGTSITATYNGVTHTVTRPTGWDPNSGVRWSGTMTFPFDPAEADVLWFDAEGGDTPHYGKIDVSAFTGCEAPATTTTVVPETTQPEPGTTTPTTVPPSTAVSSTVPTTVGSTTSVASTIPPSSSSTTTTSSTTTSSTVPTTVATTTTSSVADSTTTTSSTTTTVPVTTTVGTPNTPPPRLAITGGDFDVAVPVAFGLLVVGAVNVWFSRRRRPIQVR